MIFKYQYEFVGGCVVSLGTDSPSEVLTTSFVEADEVARIDIQVHLFLFF